MNIIAVNIESDILISICNHFLLMIEESVFVMKNMHGLFLLLISSVCMAQEDCKNLFTAASKGAVQDVRMLLESGVDANIQDASGATALMYAVNYGRLDCINLLIEKGANPKTRNQHRWTPLLLAEFNADHYGNKAEIVAILKEASAKK